MHLSVKLYATITTLIVDTIDDTASVICNTVNLQWGALILYHVRIDIQYIYIRYIFVLNYNGLDNDCRWRGGVSISSIVLGDIQCQCKRS
jgi:hypothetical protein